MQMLTRALERFVHVLDEFYVTNKPRGINMDPPPTSLEPQPQPQPQPQYRKSAFSNMFSGGLPSFLQLSTMMTVLLALVAALFLFVVVFGFDPWCDISGSYASRPRHRFAHGRGAW
jgi:hypothetical protein